MNRKFEKCQSVGRLAVGMQEGVVVKQARIGEMQGLCEGRAHRTFSYMRFSPAQEPFPLSGPNMGCVQSTSTSDGSTDSSSCLGYTWGRGGTGNTRGAN